MDNGIFTGDFLSFSNTEHSGFVSVGYWQISRQSPTFQQYTFFTGGAPVYSNPTYTRIHANDAIAALNHNYSMLVLNSSFLYQGEENIGRFFGTATEQSSVYVQSDNKILVAGQISSSSGRKNIGLVRYSSVVGAARQKVDFDNDNKSDISLFRPSSSTWYVSQSSDNGVSAPQWGLATDKIVPADYDGDGTTDYAVFRDGTWYILNNRGTFQSYQWGTTGDIPVSADFDGDGKADVTVFRNGTWYIFRYGGSSSLISNWGTTGDIPVTADYDGDGKADFAIFPQWHLVGIEGDKR